MTRDLSSSLISKLVQVIPEAEQPWVIAALRQDALVWSSLQEAELFSEVSAQTGTSVQAWSPAALALSCVQGVTTPGAEMAAHLRSDLAHALDTSLRRKVAEVLDSGPGSARTADGSRASNRERLAKAALMAFALRERRRMVGSWEGLVDELDRYFLPGQVYDPRAVWSTPLACLYGLVPEPTRLLAALIDRRAGSVYPDLALHAVLSNPLSPAQQEKQLLDLFALLDIYDSLALAQRLAEQRPSLAAACARYLLDHKLQGETPVPSADPTVEQIQELEDLLLGAEVSRLAQDSAAAFEKLSTAQEIISRIQAAVSASQGMNAFRQGNHAAGLEALEMAVELTPNQDEARMYRAELAKACLESDYPEEARRWLPEAGDGFGPGQAAHLPYSLTAARLEQLYGDRSLAHSQAAGLLDAVSSGDNQLPLADLLELARLLQALDDPAEAEQAVRLALQCCPASPALLDQLAEVLADGVKLDEAAEAVRMAIAMEPGQIERRRQLAGYLEANHDWDAALAERRTILSQVKEAEPLDDWLALAKCALSARQFNTVVEYTQRYLEHCTDESRSIEAHVLLAEAYVAQGEQQLAQEHFNQVTETAPHRPGPWLGLARLLKENGQNKRALETLLSAAQAAPTAPEIQLALGEAYLDDWEGHGHPALAQALAAFRRASQLVTPDKRKGDPSLQISLRLGQTLHQLGHLDEARQTLEAAYQDKPSFPGLAYAYGLCLLASGSIAAALSPLDKAVRQEPHNAQIKLDYGRALLKEGSRPAEAAQNLQQAFELDPACIEAQVLLAEALKDAGDPHGALSAYQQAASTQLMEDPAWNTRISLGMAQTALTIQQPETAIQALSEAVQKAPGDPTLARALSDAYQHSGQVNEAIEYARTALRLATEDINVLAWFGRQVAHWLGLDDGIGPDTATKQGIPWDAHLQLRVEALNALGHALELAPYRTDLRVLLGGIQWLAGDKEDALSTFHQAAQEEFATPEDLHQAAQYLLMLGDAAAAAACLERALRSIRETGAGASSPQAELELAETLVTAYQQASNLAAALKIVDQALALDPQNASALSKKAGLLMEMGRTQEALSCLEEGIALQPGPVYARQLHYRMALIYRSMGRLPSALQHVETSLAASQQTPVDAEAFQARLLAADLARAMLQLERGRAFLEAQPIYEPLPTGRECDNREDAQLSGGIEAARPIDYLCLRAELDLERGDELEAASSVQHAVLMREQWGEGKITPGRLRLSVLEARMKARQGGPEPAQQIFQDAIAREDWNLGEGVLSQISQLPSLNMDCGSLLTKIDQAPCRTLMAVSEAALEFGLWDIALYLLRQACEAAPLEPLSFTKLARGLVLRAEAQQLCQHLHVTNHSPGPAAIAGHASASFQQAIDTASQLIDHWRAEAGTDIEPVIQNAYNELERWRARGQAVFSPSPDHTAALADLPSFGKDPAEVSAYIAALHHQACGQPAYPALGPANPAAVAAAIQAVRSFPQLPQVLAQLALVLSSAVENLPDALKAARQAVRLHTGKPVTILNAPLPLPLTRTALYNALLAHIGLRSGAYDRAKEAIQAALSVWPNEPRWQNLAGEINISLSNLTAATEHLEQAVVLEPRHIPHYLALGRAYLKQPENGRAGGSPEGSSLGRAIHALDQACHLAPEQVEPWLALARAYQSANELDRAAACAEKALELSPQLVQPLLLRGEIALAAGDYKLAYDHIQMVLSNLPADNRQMERDPGVVLLLARSLDGLGQPEEALNTVEAAIPEAEEPLLLLLERIKLVEKLSGTETALESLLDLGKHYPDSPHVLALLAEHMARAGENDKAVNHAQHALQIVALQPEDRQELNVHEQSRLHCLLGELLRKTGQLDQAVHQLNEAIQKTPNSVDAYLELGLAYQDRRQHPQAIQIYQKAAAFAPYDPRPYLHAGLALRESKDYLASEEMLRRAADLAPADLSIHRQLGAVVALNLVHNRRKRSGEE